MRIYLAGGMRPRPIDTFKPALEAMAQIPRISSVLLNGRTELAWADLVRHTLRRGHEVFDPRENATKAFEDYSFLDVIELRRTELAIAFLERDNPSGMGLAAEIGFLKGRGASVLLINEKDDRYTRFIENFADRVFHRLEDAIPVISRIRV